MAQEGIMSFFRRTRDDIPRPTNPLNLPPQVYSFLMGIAEDCGIPLTAAEKEDMVEKMASDFNFFMAGSLMRTLSPPTYQEYIRLNAAGRPPTEIHTFLVANLPDAQTFFAECFIAFRNLYLAGPSRGLLS
jgi:hypothetical protein